jgi:hypothetical protein
MLVRLVQFVLVFSAIALGCASVSAQRGADNMSVFTGHCQDVNLSKFEKESCVKIRIEKDKKDYEEMLKRGDEVERLAARLVRSFELTGNLSGEDRNLLESLEKNVKKIREELGGDGDDEKIDEVLGPEVAPTSANAVDKLKTSVGEFVEALKKTTRFSISAAAIESSNAILTVARFLRIKN